MKRVFLALLTLSCLIQAANAQETTRSVPSVGGGLLAGANYSRFKITDRGSLSLNSNWKFGYAGGVYLNFPLSRVFSVEPQAFYNSVGSKIQLNGNDWLDQQLNYISVPLLFKFNAGRVLAFNFGPQMDFRVSAHERITDQSNEKGYRSSTILGTAGIELFPMSAVSVYGRYTHSLEDILNDNPGQQKWFNQGFQAGLKFKLFGNKVKSKPIPPPPPPMPPADTDGDGVMDSVDKCPTVFGYAKYDGCPIPDKDNDGVSDELDKCPDVAGSAKYNGCPIPDTDGDGINDEEDKCPNEKGVKEYNGCPVPDSDKDGIPDPRDKCPNIPGVKENDGCPAIPKFHASNIQFVTGKATLTPASLKELTEIVVYMNQYKDIYLDIQGHTDDVGSDASNQVLSEKRAAAVKAALLKRGLPADKLTAQGFGETVPIEDNTTPEGRKANRRVEFKFSTH